MTAETCPKCGAETERAGKKLAKHNQPARGAYYVGQPQTPCRNRTPFRTADQEPLLGPLWTFLAGVLVVVALVALGRFLTGWEPQKPTQSQVEDGTWEPPAAQYP